ncbi:hypothetical protein AHAS_Ahas10G0009900 [Arachis hypogaea]
MNQVGGTKGPVVEDEEPEAVAEAQEKNEAVEFSGEQKQPPVENPMEEDSVTTTPATVFCIRLKQPKSHLLHKMSVPEVCRNFSVVSWCGKLNAIACASETCARIPSSTANPPFWIPIHIVIPERPTECAVFDVLAVVPYFLSRALLIANFHGRVTIWTQPSQGPANLVRDTSYWQLEHEWRQDIAVVTKWLSGVPLYRWLSSKSSCAANSKSIFEEKFISQQFQTSGSVQLHWSQWPHCQNAAPARWFCTSKGLLGCGPSGIMDADAIIMDSGAMHVAGVPIVNPSTVVVWEVMPGPGNAYVSPEAAAQSSAATTWGSGVTAVAFDPTRGGFVIAVVIIEGMDLILS